MACDLPSHWRNEHPCFTSTVYETGHRCRLAYPVQLASADLYQPTRLQTHHVVQHVNVSKSSVTLPFKSLAVSITSPLLLAPLELPAIIIQFPLFDHQHGARIFRLWTPQLQNMDSISTMISKNSSKVEKILAFKHLFKKPKIKYVYHCLISLFSSVCFVFILLYSVQCPQVSWKVLLNNTSFYSY